MTQDTQARLIEDLHKHHQNHWKHQWASDMVREEDEDHTGEDDYSFRNDWDEWFWARG